MTTCPPSNSVARAEASVPQHSTGRMASLRRIAPNDPRPVLPTVSGDHVYRVAVDHAHDEGFLVLSVVGSPPRWHEKQGRREKRAEIPPNPALPVCPSRPIMDTVTKLSTAKRRGEEVRPD